MPAQNRSLAQSGLRPPRPSSSPRGYALILVVIVTMLVAVAVTTMYLSLTSSAHSGREMLERKQAFHATDGMTRGVVQLSNDFLRKNPAATTAELQASFTTAALDSITPTGFTREAFDVSTTGMQTGPVPNGAFEGMDARQFPVSTVVKLRKTSSEASSRQATSVVLAQIAAFQFMVFSDGFADWIPGAPQDVRGRVHANGDICIGSDSTFRLQRITASGGLHHAANSACQAPRAGIGAARLSNTATGFTTFATIAPDREHGCTTCGGAAGDWAAWAPGEFAGNAKDADLGGAPLRLPITGTPQTQRAKAANNTAVFNTQNSRLLVDPVRAGDASDVREQKLAFLSDIRIINGVWYIADPVNNAANWPGTPIWSDHPGRHSITAADTPVEHSLVGTKAVGQADIREDWAARGFAWPAVPPRLYSYYETETLTGLMVDGSAVGGTPQGVVSYGGLMPTGAAPQRWVPAHWPGVAGSNNLCTLGGLAAGGMRSAFTANECTLLGDIPTSAALLNATRSGFRDGHVQAQVAAFSGGNAAQHSKMLTTNFDVATFRQALQTTTAGELGSYFCVNGGGCYMNRRFNGIVYITNTWEGSLNGFAADNTATAPMLWPRQHANGHGVMLTPQPNIQTASGVAGGSDNNTQQRALPYPLCTGTTIAPLPGSAFHVAPLLGGNRFTIPSCADPLYQNERGARPNAVRVFNGDVVALDYDGDGTEDGMTFASNLPVYVLGEWNVRNSAGTPIDTSSITATPWVPTLVAGDQVYMLSNNWSDERQPWDINFAPARSVAADVTQYNIAVLAGWSVSRGNQYSGGVENFPRYLETWGTTRVNRIRGSFLIGFNSVYFAWPRASPYTAPMRDWAFDEHLDNLDNQPPGAPEYNIYATRSWSRQ